MQKIVDFGISESSNMERLNSGHEALDLVNGTGEYLGMIHFGNHEVMITRTISSGKGKYDGQIMANEVEYDTYPDGSIAIYYNKDKSDELYQLQQQLNRPIIEEKLSNGKNIKDALFDVGIDVSAYTTNMEERINNEFRPGERFIYPDNFDFDEALRLGFNYSKDKDIKKVPIQQLIVTGISKQLFENLKRARKYTHMSTYEMAALLNKLENDKSKSR